MFIETISRNRYRKKNDIMMSHVHTERKAFSKIIMVRSFIVIIVIMLVIIIIVF